MLLEGGRRGSLLRAVGPDAESLVEGMDWLRGCRLGSLPCCKVDACTSRHTPSAQTTAASLPGSAGCTTPSNQLEQITACKIDH